MGLYDSITGNFCCPFCGNLITEFQTKDFEKGLMYYTLTEAYKIMKTRKTTEFTMYDYCKRCGEWIELTVMTDRHTKPIWDKTMKCHACKKQIKDFYATVFSSKTNEGIQKHFGCALKD